MSEEQKEVDYLPWYPGQPNGGRHQHCTEAKIDPSQDLGEAHKIESHAQHFYAIRILISFSKHTNIIPAEVYFM